MVERVDAQAYKTLQRTLLERAGFPQQQVEVAVGRFTKMPSGAFGRLIRNYNLRETAQFLYALTGAKPATTIKDDNVNLVPIAAALEMPHLNYFKLTDNRDGALRGGCIAQHFEPWLLGHDAETFEAFKGAVIAKDAVGIGKALGYPDPSKNIFNFPDINTAAYRQHQDGRRYKEPMLYIEPACVHSLSEAVEKAGRLRKASLLAYECEVAKRGAPEWYAPHNVARVMASCAAPKWHRFAAELGILDEIPRPNLPALEELASGQVAVESVL